MNKCPNARAVVFEAAPEIEHRRRRRPRERRLKAGKMLRWSILSESPSSCAAKACGAWVGERLAKCETEVTQPAAPRKKKDYKISLNFTMRMSVSNRSVQIWFFLDSSISVCGIVLGKLSKIYQFLHSSWAILSFTSLNVSSSLNKALLSIIAFTFMSSGFELCCLFWKYHWRGK